MKTKKASHPYISSAAQHADYQARMFEAFSDPESMPSARIRASRDLRYGGMVATGYDSMPGAAGTYHLNSDFARHVTALCRTLAGENDYAGLGTRRAKAKAVVQTLSFLVGYRWTRGTENLHDALKAAGMSAARLTVYTAQREAFATRLARVLDATQVHLDERQNDLALQSARSVIGIALDEVEALGGWLLLAGDRHARETVAAHAEGARVIAQFDSVAHLDRHGNRRRNSQE